MKVIVDYDKCASNARCMKACPEVFVVQKDGFLYLLQEEPGEALRSKVEQAARDCPTGAIRIEG
jgi:ferredoxin